MEEIKVADDQNVSLERVKKVLLEVRDMRRTITEKTNALEKINIARADYSRRMEVHIARVAELDKESNTATAADVEALRSSLANLTDEGLTLAGMAEQTLIELKNLGKRASAVDDEIGSINALVKALCELLTDKK